MSTDEDLSPQMKKMVCSKDGEIGAVQPKIAKQTKTYHMFITFSLKHLQFCFLKSEVIIFPSKPSFLLGSYISVKCITTYLETQTRNLEVVPYFSLFVTLHFLISHQFYYPHDPNNSPFHPRLPFLLPQP